LPKMEVGAGEGVQQRLMREAIEFQELFHGELDSVPATRTERIKAVLNEICQTGMYTQSSEEIEFGARVAWRNTAKCANRSFWNELVVRDRRKVTTNREMYKECLLHLEKAIETRLTSSIMTVFPARNTENQSPRIWNSQLIRYAAYNLVDGTITGDPANLGFTDMVIERFGWIPPTPRGQFDVLPLIIQSTTESPQMFDIPDSYIPRVQIWHPQYPFLANLKLEWYAIPAVSSIGIEIGGLKYDGIPFNGWYADTEVVRDLADESRYDCLPMVAKEMGLEVTKNSTLWRDEALLVLNKAVVFSFEHAQMAMVDHHTLIRGFDKWYSKEMQERGYCPGNWKWIIPPVASATSPAYMGLNKMTEYTLKPMYYNAKSWKKLEKEYFGKRDGTIAKKAFKIMLTCTHFCGKMLAKVRPARTKALIIFASVSGNTRRHATEMARYLEQAVQIDVLDAADFNPSDFGKFDRPLQQCEVLLLMTSTYGHGDVPKQAEKLLKFVKEGRANSYLKGKLFGVLGFGSSDYPMFCQGALAFDDALSKAGGDQVCTVGKCDSKGGERATMLSWTRTLIANMAQFSKERAWPRLMQQMDSRRFSTASNQLHLEVTRLTASETSKVALESLIAGKSRESKTAYDVESFSEENQMQIGVISEVVRCIGGDDVKAGQFGRASSLIKIDISQAGCPAYVPGDHVEIVPNNVLSEEILEDFASALGIGADEVFVVNTHDGARVRKAQHPLLYRIQGRHTTLRHVFSWVAGINQTVDLQACQVLATLAIGESQRKLLQYAFATTTTTWSLRWQNLLSEFPGLRGSLSLETLLQVMPINTKRLYSVASSQTMEQDEVHLLVGRLVYQTAQGRSQAGAASNYLTLLGPGARIPFKVVKATGFHLPCDNRAPLILIGAGTGMAPFRGFWQERLNLIKNANPVGRAALIFGCRTESELLMKEELDECMEKGALNYLMVAYSRDKGHPKRYVHDVVREERNTLREMLHHPKCHVYICGDSNLVLPLQTALREVSKSGMRKIVAGKRFHLDVFGMLERNEMTSEV